MLDPLANRSTVSLMQPLRTFHKVEVRITAKTPNGTGTCETELADILTFQVANATSAIGAAIAVEQYIAKSAWKFDDYGWFPIKEVILLSVNPTAPDPRLFHYPTLICNPAPEPGKRQVVYQECSREESVHGHSGGSDLTMAYYSDGSSVYHWIANVEYGNQCIADGSMVHMRLLEGFKLERKSEFLQIPIPITDDNDLPPAHEDLAAEEKEVERERLEAIELPSIRPTPEAIMTQEGPFTLAPKDDEEVPF